MIQFLKFETIDPVLRLVLTGLSIPLFIGGFGYFSDTVVKLQRNPFSPFNVLMTTISVVINTIFFLVGVRYFVIFTLMGGIQFFTGLVNNMVLGGEK